MSTIRTATENLAKLVSSSHGKIAIAMGSIIVGGTILLGGSNGYSEPASANNAFPVMDTEKITIQDTVTSLNTKKIAVNPAILNAETNTISDTIDSTEELKLKYENTADRNFRIEWEARTMASMGKLEDGINYLLNEGKVDKAVELAIDNLAFDTAVDVRKNTGDVLGAIVLAEQLKKYEKLPELYGMLEKQCPAKIKEYSEKSKIIKEKQESAMKIIAELEKKEDYHMIFLVAQENELYEIAFKDGQKAESWYALGMLAKSLKLEKLSMRCLFQFIDKAIEEGKPYSAACAAEELPLYNSTREFYELAADDYKKRGKDELNYGKGPILSELDAAGKARLYERVKELEAKLEKLKAK